MKNQMNSEDRTSSYKKQDKDLTSASKTSGPISGDKFAKTGMEQKKGGKSPK